MSYKLFMGNKGHSYSQMEPQFMFELEINCFCSCLREVRSNWRQARILWQGKEVLQSGLCKAPHTSRCPESGGRPGGGEWRGPATLPKLRGDCRWGGWNFFVWFAELERTPCYWIRKVVQFCKKRSFGSLYWLLNYNVEFTYSLQLLSNCFYLSL